MNVHIPDLEYILRKLGAITSHDCKRDINTRMRQIRMSERTMPVCCTQEQFRAITEYAKSRGMLNASQAVEELLE